MVDSFGTADAFKKNVEMEFERNGERYAFLRWGQTAFDNFRVVPPGTGICHQVNLEYLAQVVWTKEEDGRTGRLSRHPGRHRQPHHHGQRPLGAGLGRRRHRGRGGHAGPAGLHADPRGDRLQADRRLKEGTTATDLVLTVVQMLRAKGVVGKFVEFYGAGLDHLTLADQATIANMAPEYGATCGFFPVDEETIRYLSFTGRDPDGRPGGSLCQGAGHVARRRPPIRSSPTPWSSTSATSSRPRRPQAPAGPGALSRRFRLAEQALRRHGQRHGDARSRTVDGDDSI